MSFPPELIIDPEEAIARRIVWDLVEGDIDTLAVRFLGLTLSDYDSIVLNFRKVDGSRFSRTVTPDGADDELGSVSWQYTDLETGRCTGEFEFTLASETFTLPRRFPVDFEVRKSIDGVPDVPIPPPDPAQIQVSVPDNDTTYITVGDVTLHRAAFLTWTLEDDAGTTFECGLLRVIHNSAGVAAVEVERTGIPTPLTSVSFDADVDGDDLRLEITALAVGSDLKFRYTKERLELMA